MLKPTLFAVCALAAVLFTGYALAAWVLAEAFKAIR